MTGQEHLLAYTLQRYHKQTNVLVSPFENIHTYRYVILVDLFKFLA